LYGSYLDTKFCCYVDCPLCDIELAFLVDSSTKTDFNAWTQMLNFVSDVVREYSIGSNCVRVAVIRYGNNADAPIQLTSYSDVDRLVAAIGQITFIGGSSNLAAALNLLRSQVFASNVVRSNTARIAIIVTDQLQSNPQITSAATSVRSQGITIVAVGITGPRRVDIEFMFTLVSNRCAFRVGDYSQLISDAKDRMVEQCTCFNPTTTPSQGMISFTFKKISSIFCSRIIGWNKSMGLKACFLSGSRAAVCCNILPAYRVAQKKRGHCYIASNLRNTA